MGNEMAIDIISLVSGKELTAVFQEEKIELKFDDHQVQGRPKMSSHELCERFVFLEWPVGWNKEVQNTDRRQIGVCLSGQLRFETSDGCLHDFFAGDSWRLRDIGVEGLNASVIGDQPVKCLIVQID